MSAGSLYQRILGPAWEALPAEVRAMHDGLVAVATGKAAVHRGAGLLARLVAAVIRFPHSGEDIPTTVRFIAEPQGETWVRTFGRQSFSSRMREGGRAAERLLCERFGPLEFAQALAWEGDKLRLVMRGWTALGVPLPLWLAPRSDSYAATRDGRYRFFVEISHPMTGPIVKYAGWLEPARPQPALLQP
jgi:hypothetical protein